MHCQSELYKTVLIQDSVSMEKQQSSYQPPAIELFKYYEILKLLVDVSTKKLLLGFAYPPLFLLTSFVP